MRRLQPAFTSPLTVAALAGSFMLGLSACSDDEGQKADGGGDSLAVATYNAGLARSFVDYAVERTDPVAAAMADLDVDVLCVQEVWEEEDWEAVTDASPLTHTYRLEAMPDDGEGGDAGMGEGGLCTQAEVDPLEACVRDKCDVPPGELTSCALTMCGDAVDALSTECLGCITGVIGDKTIDEVVAVCGPDGSGSGSQYTYGGSFGTGILSSAALSGPDALVLESTTTRRAVLYARVLGADGEPLHLFCTHLTANLSNVPYTGKAGSWAQENADQITAALAYIEDKAGDGRFLLLGDLNTGPAVDGVVAELPENYALLSDLDNPYVDQSDALCTFCSDNPLVGEADGGESVLIDHIMLGGWSGVEAAGQRILDGPLSLEVAGETVETAYSDHYGLQTELSY